MKLQEESWGIVQLQGKKGSFCIIKWMSYKTCRVKTLQIGQLMDQKVTVYTQQQGAMNGNISDGGKTPLALSNSYKLKTNNMFAIVFFVFL